MSNQGAAMSNGRPNSVNNTGPLRRQLAGLGVRAAGAPLPCFGERLARLFDLSDTVALDAANVASRDGYFGADGKAAERLRAELEKLISAPTAKPPSGCARSWRNCAKASGTPSKPASPPSASAPATACRRRKPARARPSRRISSPTGASIRASSGRWPPPCRRCG